MSFDTMPGLLCCVGIKFNINHKEVNFSVGMLSTIMRGSEYNNSSSIMPS